MVIFNYEQLIAQGIHSGLSLIDILVYCKTGKTPRYNRPKYLKISPSRVLSGTSFIKQEILLKEEGCAEIYKNQYIALCSKRSYFLYKHSGVLSLDREHYPDLNMANIVHNPLITVTHSEIKFKLEF